MLPLETLWLILGSGLAALLYSSVGHGGGSAYLAMLALAGIARDVAAPTALALNVLAAGIGAIQYGRAAHFEPRLLIPFALTSIPMATLGGTLALPERLFSTLLGLALLVASLRFLVLSGSVVAPIVVSERRLWSVGLPVGAVLGFFSGLIGIGGGIFLSPLLMLMRWADAKKTAMVSAAFIVLNSLSGLVGHATRGIPDGAWALTGSLALAVATGGVIGAYWGAFRLRPVTLQRLLGAVLLMAALKLLKSIL
jgi:uncharacterized membrane protein YfcA